MGLFDFLNKKEKTPAGTQTKGPLPKEDRPYLGDLNKTDKLFGLLKTPREGRDETWQAAFLENIAGASFRAGDPQVKTGPDGFPYFQLFLPEPNKSFQCYVIERMTDDFLLKSGYGVVINPTPTSADWVLPYGDLLNLKLNDTFYTTTETPFSQTTADEVLAEDEKVMVAQPSETILPKETRQLISAFLKSAGVETPKVLLMMRHKKDGQGAYQNIVFNVSPKNFSEADYRSVMRTISWYLPRHYSFVGMEEENLGDNFMPL